MVLFIRISYPFHKTLVDNFFFAFNPLVALVMIITGTTVAVSIIGSIVMVLLTVFFGRLFCGWACPLGTIFDSAARLFPAKKAKPPYGNGRYKNIKYYLLIFLFAGSFAGFSAVLMFDPLVFIFRVFTLNVYPFIVLAANQFLNLIRPAALKFGFYGVSMLSYEQPVFNLGLLNLLFFLTVIGLIAVERRFWCRNLCPLGAFLGLLSRFSLWRRRVADTCTACSLCARTCPMNAIGDDFLGTSSRECIVCERCSPVCPVDAISFTAGSPGPATEFDPSRRGALVSGIGGIVAGLAAGSSVSAKTTNGALLRPPGALVEKDFLDSCLRCGECMKACPTHALQPSFLQSGFEGLFTPVLVPCIGACEEQCNICGLICPTGAIRSLPLEEKQYAVIGNAAIDRSLCIAWEQGKICLICDEVCPYDAVEFRLVVDEKGAIKRPFVIEDKCTGCGQCEHGCPVNGPKAIHVTPVNEVRKNTGSYITEKVKRLREVDDDFVDFTGEKSLYQNEQEPVQPGGESPDEFEDDVPAGFGP